MKFYYFPRWYEVYEVFKSLKISDENFCLLTPKTFWYLNYFDAFPSKNFSLTLFLFLLLRSLIKVFQFCKFWFFLKIFPHLCFWQRKRRFTSIQFDVISFNYLQFIVTAIFFRWFLMKLLKSDILEPSSNKKMNEGKREKRMYEGMSPMTLSLLKNLCSFLCDPPPREITLWALKCKKKIMLFIIKCTTFLSTLPSNLNVNIWP